VCQADLCAVSKRILNPCIIISYLTSLTSASDCCSERTLFPADDSWELVGDSDDGDATNDGGGGGGIGRDTGYDLGSGML